MSVHVNYKVLISFSDKLS